jgi:PKD repeat protein
MSLNAGTTADQSISATDADGDPLTFSKTSGPTFMTVTTTTPGTGSATGNIHLAPGLGDAGTSSGTVAASDGTASNTKTFSITVNAGANQPPTLTQPANMTVNEGATADQVLTGSDPDANPLTFSKVSGPTYMTVTTLTATTGNIHLAPGFSDAGTASATVRANDGNGGTNDKSLTITVNNTNRAPVLTQPANMSVAEGATADQVITGTDPDGDALTFTKISGPTFMTVTTLTATTGNIHLAAGALEPVGTSSATVQASDGSLNDQKSLTITVTATNHPPVLTQPANMTVAEGATADQAITGTDPDGDPLTFTKVSGPSYMTVTTTNATTGNIHLAPGFSDAGTASATVQASDGSLNNQKSLTITVNNTNRAPTLNAIANMTVTQGATADQVITGSDPDGDPLTFTQISGPTFMSVTTTTATTGNIHLAPGALEPTGVTAASVRAADGALFSNVQPFTVTVNPAVVNNNPPVLAQPSNMTVNENATADQALTATDQDGNPLSFSKVAGPSFMTVTTVTPGTGTGTGNIHLAPGFSDAGTYSATVRADDGNGGTNDKSLTITVNNVDRSPVLNAISPMTVIENSTADQTITGSDPDGDALTFSKVTGPTFVTITTTTATSGNVHAAPGIGDAGVYTVQAQVSDGSLTDTEIFQVTVNPFVAANNPPVLAQPSDMTVAEGATADQTITATDADGDPLSFSKVSGPAFLTVTTTTAGTGTGTGQIHLAPGFSDAGTYSATVRATDSKANSDKTLTITVTNVNRQPTLAAISDMTVTEGATADQTITGSDPDGDALTFSKASGPAFMTVVPMSATSANIHLAPGAGTAGTYSASATASDGDLSDTKSFTITVNAGQVDHAPVLTQPDNMTVDEGQTADQTLNATDPDADALSFTKVGGPTFMTVGTTSPTTGNVHLAPGFADAGTYTGTVRASDGSLSDDKSFTITVNNVNRAPVADAGGPYTGIVNVALSFNGSGSSDPDGDALTYAWDFDATDGITVDATGATPSHTYTVAGTYTVTLTVSDGTLSGTDTATATISESGGFQADASVTGGDRIIRLQANKPFWCVDITPVGDSFKISDIIPTSVRLSYNGSSIPSIGRRVVEDEQDGSHSAQLCFSKDQLRTLFADLSNGRHDVTLTITGDLQGGGSFVATLDVTVQKTGGPNAAAKHGVGPEDAFVWASPNPLNPSTVIRFALSQPGRVSLNVYDLQGRLVKALANQFMEAGVHDVRWDGSTRTGTRVASGVYFYVLQTPERTVKSQLVVAK